MHFVVQRIRWNLNESMFDTNVLYSMCELEQRIADTEGYEHICQREVSSESSCCRPWSLPNYVALLSNKTSCFDINVSYCLFSSRYRLSHPHKSSLNLSISTLESSSMTKMLMLFVILFCRTTTSTWCEVCCSSATSITMA